MSTVAPQLRVNKNPRFDYCQGLGSGGCTDLDVLWERNGHFLVIENKHPGELIDLGQLIALRALDALPQFTVWVVYGYPPANLVSIARLEGEPVEASTDDVRGFIQRWWDTH